MENNDIAIIINSFNRLELLKQCLGVLSKWIPKSELSGHIAAVVFDAGSSDGSTEWLKENILNFGFPLNVIVSKPNEDSSFSAGINAGVSFAKQTYPNLKYVMFYETDNQILTSTPLLHALIQLKEKNDLGACGFTVRQHDGSSAGVGTPFPNLFNFIVGRNIVQKFQLESLKYNWEVNAANFKFSEIDVVYTSPLLVKIEAWDDGNGFDAVVFPFSDCDIDWARRLYDCGWKMGVIKSNDVIHDNLSTLSAWSKSRAMQFHRGRLRYLKRYYPISIYTIWPVFLLGRHVLELFAVKLFVRDPKRRAQLHNQFKTLLKTCIKSYE